MTEHKNRIPFVFQTIVNIILRLSFNQLPIVSALLALKYRRPVLAKGMVAKLMQVFSTSALYIMATF